MMVKNEYLETNNRLKLVKIFCDYINVIIKD